MFRRGYRIIFVTGLVVLAGDIGDGKIFILDLPECIRIRTGDAARSATNGVGRGRDRLD